MRINYESSGAPTSGQNESGSVKQDIVLDIYRLALGHAPKSDDDKSKCIAASRVLAWLGMATLDKKKQFNCKPGYLLKLYGADSLKGQRRSKSQRTFLDTDFIESIIDAGLGHDSGDWHLRDFVRTVLAVLRLASVTKHGWHVPTKRLKRLAVWRRDEERQVRRQRHYNKDAELAKWLAIRKEAGLHIDPETADVMWDYGQTLDPYGVDPDLPPELCQVGREYFARAPGSDVWVLFDDLPSATRQALWGKHRPKLAFPAGLS
jgi:hypothetical protein